MTIALQGLRTVIYPEADLDAGKAWWTATLGRPPYFDQPFYVGIPQLAMNSGCYPTPIAPMAPQRIGASMMQPRPSVTRWPAGQPKHTPLSEVGDGIVTGAVRTPQGAVLGLIYNPHFQLP